MANPKHLATLLKSKSAWEKWRRNNPDEKPNLHEADLSGHDFYGVDLSGANLSSAELRSAYLPFANLSSADLRGADLISANLDSADLRGADLRGATLTFADLGSANLRWADLRGADLDSADLRGADLRGATLGSADFSRVELFETVFVNTNLRDVKGLDTCSHRAPSIIDYRTLARSGPLPLAFLRGCGLPDKFIEYLPSLFWNEPIQFYSCFISYSTKDQPFADRLFADLQNKGVRCWFAPHHIRAGKKIHEQIVEAIRLYDRLLLIISEHSMKSRWVKTEIANARKKEQLQGRKVLFPIGLAAFDAIRSWNLFDADIGDDSASEIREFFIPDFSNWKDHDTYQKEFERLVRDLKAETATE